MKSLFKSALLATFATLAACSLPVNELTPNERKADMAWVFQTFKHNYAPVDLKKEHYGLELSQLESDCMTMAQEEMSNPKFIALMQRCIHSFKDAHVAGQQMNNGILPEYAQVAHLGFLTSRTRVSIDGQMTEALRIIDFLKGADVGAPVVLGDLILAAEGLPIEQYLKEELIPYMDVGQDETNLSASALRFGVRTSTDMAMPQEDFIKIKIFRDERVIEISMPWIVEDLLSFQLVQNPPQEEGTGSNGPIVPNPNDGPIATQLVVQNPLSLSFFGFNQLVEVFGEPLEKIANRIKHIATRGFKMMRFNPLFKSILYADGELEQSFATRSFPLDSEVSDLIENALFTAKAITNENGETYAYIQLANFPGEDQILSDWIRAVNAVNDQNIKGVIIDLIDNGGGSLIHGMRMLNMMRQKMMELPSIQVRLNNNWMNAFKSQAAFSESPYIKAINKKIVRDLEEDKRAGKKLSRVKPISILDPFFLQNPSYGFLDDVKVAILVNEGCISMCDIFASVFQDNEMGVVIGQRTMGGGGNVTQHGVTPVSKFGVSLTESLIISPKGKYIEDNGVEPDMKIDMVADREQGFPMALLSALNYILPVQD